jgi:ABC-type nitrate/sulfonate/bicarbonate transport system substrate-binding protein
MALGGQRSACRWPAVIGHEPARLAIGRFSLSAPLAVAHASGMFAADDLAVTSVPATSSVEQFAALLDGRLDLVLTSPDNVLTYRVNRGNPLGRVADVRILRGVDLGFGLSLMAGPRTSRVGSVAQLRGQRLGVDVATSGFAFALFELLRRAGLGRGDYEVVQLGSTPRRAEALLAGGCAATLLNAGHDCLAEHAGATRLARVSVELGPYPGTVLAATAGWAEEHPDVLGRFLAAWDTAVTATLDRARTGFVREVVAEGLATSRPVADAVVRTLLDPAEGLLPDGLLPVAAWDLVVDLRRAADGFDTDVDVAGLYGNPPTAATAAGTRGTAPRQVLGLAP